MSIKDIDQDKPLIERYPEVEFACKEHNCDFDIIFQCKGDPMHKYSWSNDTLATFDLLIAFLSKMGWHIVGQEPDEEVACRDSGEHSWISAMLTGISFRYCASCDRLERKLYGPSWESYPVYVVEKTRQNVIGYLKREVARLANNEV